MRRIATVIVMVIVIVIVTVLVILIIMARYHIKHTLNHQNIDNSGTRNNCQAKRKHPKAPQGPWKGAVAYFHKNSCNMTCERAAEAGTMNMLVQILAWKPPRIIEQIVL